MHTYVGTIPYTYANIHSNMYVLVTFSCQLATTYNHLERRPKLRNYMDQIDLWACLPIIYLVVDYDVILVQADMGFTTNWDDHELKRESIHSIATCFLPLMLLFWIPILTSHDGLCSETVRWNKPFYQKLFLATVFNTATQGRLAHFSTPSTWTQAHPHID